jgi:hypothetical protein
MRCDQPRQNFLSFGCESEANTPAIRIFSFAREQSGGHQTIHQANRAVMLNEKICGQISNAGTAIPGKTPDGHECLVLLRVQAGLPRRSVAKVQELAQSVSKLGEATVVTLAEFSGGGMSSHHRVLPTALLGYRDTI